MNELTEQDIQAWKEKLNAMTHEELAALRRFAPSGHPVFNMHYPLYKHFEELFEKGGGMTPNVSKKIGW